MDAKRRLKIANDLGINHYSVDSFSGQYVDWSVVANDEVQLNVGSSGNAIILLVEPEVIGEIGRLMVAWAEVVKS